MRRKKVLQIDTQQEWEDKVFIISRGLTGRLSGDPNVPDAVRLTLMYVDPEGEDNSTAQVAGLVPLRILCAELQDFLSKMDSKGVH